MVFRPRRTAFSVDWCHMRRAGDILLLHDGISPQSRRDPSATIAAIRPLIEGLAARQLEVAALDKLIGGSRTRIRPGTA